MSKITKPGFEYSFDPKFCQQCEGNCCHGEPGYIWVNKEEIAEIAAYMDLNTIDFINGHLYKVDYRYSLVEIPFNSGYCCILFDKGKKRCSIYPVRPKQCRTYPFWDRFRNKNQDLLAECPGVIKCSPDL